MDGKGSSSPISGLRASSNDLETHPAGSRPTRPMVINASCASKAASTLTAEKYTRVIRVSATPSKNPPCLRFTCQSWRYAVDPQGGGGSYAAEATHKLGRIDHSARVRPYADLPVALGGMHAKFDPRPSILVTSASPVTMLPTTVGARWRTVISVPTGLSPGSR